MSKLLERIETALGAMAASGPRSLRAYLEQPGPDFEKASASEINTMLDLLLSSDPNNSARLRFSGLLRSWDNVKDAKWTDTTTRNSEPRRRRIHDLMKSGADLAARIDALLPFYHLEEPLIIAEEHKEWYVPVPGIRDYYWSTYIRYLQQQRGWDDASILDIDNSTRAIVECLANPESRDSYSSRGLVVGYVQSGKTANFAGVVARAADAGYRLIIVLAGTWNILRNQTQRRFDKELLGKELLNNDEAYTLHTPPDWSEFLEHGTDPVELGHYAWQRLTRPDIDFRRLKAAIDNLEFEKPNKALPIFDPSNLHSLPVKLLVIKKHAGILGNLVKDLRLIRTKLTDLPTIVVDDESDQAGLNTVDPKRALTAEHKKRNPTNERIVELLQLFPRGQYIGYTATPYANAFIDPDDPEDLFPKDFIISLNRPRRYMGVSDFFDPATDYEDLRKTDFSQAEIAFIRRVENPVGSDDEDLKKALRSYVLAGGLKLYREAKDPQLYKAEHFRHHTMLIHTSQLKGEHGSLAERVKELWDQCAHNSPAGMVELQKLWTDDYRQVCAARSDELVPTDFAELIPYLSDAIKRIEKGQKFILVVNSDSPEAPDFSTGPVWKIVLGGNKLSRGYTIEGLTISYYRRVAGAADTLMQMGRWFGFRPGYQDLVRVFLGVVEGKRGDTDLVSLFKEVCRMEERFREEIKRYLRKPGVKRITPKDIPPLISISASIPPTASNKMFNAVLASKNFGGQWSMPVLSPTGSDCKRENIKSVSRLIAGGEPLGKSILGGRTKDGRSINARCFIYETGNEEVIAFLKAYRWLEADYKYPERPTDTALQIEFLEKEHHEITSWLILAPQRQASFGAPLKLTGVAELAVKERHRIAGRSFQVFGESAHRAVAEYLTAGDPGNLDLAAPNPATKVLRNQHRGTFLFYPVREEEADEVSVGFELFFPENKLGFDLNFTVRRKAEKDRVVVQASAG